MFKKGDFFSYFFGVLIGITATLLLTLKFWGNAWWQVAIACAAGVLIGLLIADYRAMAGICKKAAKKTADFLRIRKLAPEARVSFGDWLVKALKTIAVVFLRCLFSFIRLALFSVFSVLAFGVVWFLFKHFFHHDLTLLGMFDGNDSRAEIIYTIFSFVFAIPTMVYMMMALIEPYDIKSRSRGLKLEKEIARENLERLFRFPKFFLSSLVYPAMLIPAAILLVGHVLAGIWNSQKLLFTSFCIVAGGLSGTLLRSPFVGLSAGAIIFLAGYFSDRFKVPAATAPFFWAHRWLDKVPVPQV